MHVVVAKATEAAENLRVHILAQDRTWIISSERMTREGAAAATYVHANSSADITKARLNDPGFDASARVVVSLG